MQELEQTIQPLTDQLEQHVQRFHDAQTEQNKTVTELEATRSALSTLEERATSLEIQLEVSNERCAQIKVRKL